MLFDKEALNCMLFNKQFKLLPKSIVLLFSTDEEEKQSVFVTRKS